MLPPLLRRREVWVPTALGWAMFLALIAGISVAAGYSVYPFLALNAPVGARTIVVEGWMDADALDEVVAALARVPYERVITTGGPRRVWPPRHDLPTYADAAAEYLRQHGLPREKVIAAPAPYTERDHTYTSALAVREWQNRSGIRLDAIDVYSVGPHTRRSRLLYEIALGPAVKVGAYAAHVTDYDPGAWWRTSDGARDVVEQALGYLWVKCCFRPQ